MNLEVLMVNTTTVNIDGLMGSTKTITWMCWMVSNNTMNLDVLVVSTKTMNLNVVCVLLSDTTCLNQSGPTRSTLQKHIQDRYKTDVSNNVSTRIGTFDKVITLTC